MALTATDWTLDELSYTATAGGHFDHHILSNGKRVKRFSMTLATAGTYGTGGIPIPTTVANWGMKRQLDHLNIYDNAQANGQVVKYSATGNVIRLYVAGGTATTATGVQINLAEMATTATAGTGGTMILYVEATGF
jgi:hypothetical protein